MLLTELVKLNQNSDMTIPERIKYLRKQSKLTQKDVADEIGVKQNHYHYIETGFFDPKTIEVVKMAKLFNVSIDYLLTGKEFKK